MCSSHIPFVAQKCKDVRRCKEDVIVNDDFFSSNIPFITQNLDYKSLINLKLTCKKFSNMIKSEDISERKRKENCEERNKIRMVWLKQPFPYFEAYRSYCSVCLPFK